MRVIVVGGGAAGFFCAVNTARMNSSLEVIILEKTSKLLSKVRISGGGRCNVTHACFSIPEMSKKYPRGANFVKRTFYDFFTEDTITWFKERGVMLKTEEDGRMFPRTDTSETIINCFLSEADKYKVGIRMKSEVTSMSRTEKNWEVALLSGEIINADAVCIASGGYPKDSMFEWIKATGHTIEPPVPSLFTFNIPGVRITELMGVSVGARVKIQGTKLEEEGSVLITHWGISGPAVLKLSARGARELNKVNYRFSVMINWSLRFSEQSLKRVMIETRELNPTQKVYNGNVAGMPQRLWEYLCMVSEIGDMQRWADLTSAQLNKLLKNTCSHELKVEGKTTYKEEFVTAGGVRLTEVNALTMESRIVPSLYFAGEILDVDGITGGFNFQHAWTSGWIAAKSMARAVKDPEPMV
jgi:predicted Rossmann fold flavoprotein